MGDEIGIPPHPAVLSSEEVSPVGMFWLSNRRDHRDGRGCFRAAEQTQTGFVRKPIGLERVDLSLCPHEILKRVATSAIARNDMIKIAAASADELSCVLANAAVALENRLATHARQDRKS